jgi:hypothetical protein
VPAAADKYGKPALMPPGPCSPSCRQVFLLSSVVVSLTVSNDQLLSLLMKLAVIPSSTCKHAPLFQEIWSCPYSMETLPSYAEDIQGGNSPSISMLSFRGRSCQEDHHCQ